MKTKRRFPGINPFQTEEQDRFFGRDADIRDLYALIALEKTVVLFGKSGHGKSSLLNAGIVPRLLAEKPGSERRYEPLVIKFGAYVPDKTAPAETTRGFMAQAFPPGPNAALIDAIRPPGEATDTLWFTLKRSGLRRVVLLFDQFEEFFTYPLAQQQRFADELSQLLHGDLPPEVADRYGALSEDAQDLLATRLDVKAVFAIREDRLHLMDKLKYPLPAIFGRRYALHPLPRTEAQEALERPAALPGFDTPAFAFAPEAMTKILDFLADDESRVETNQLQILAESFEKRAEQEGIARFTPENLGALKTIVKDYYLDRIHALPAEADRLAARQLCEEGLTQEGDPPVRLNLHEAQIQRFYNIGPALLETLVANRLLRAEPGAGGGYTYELPHDTMLEPVLELKRERMEQEALAREAEEKKRLREEAESAQQRAREAEARRRRVTILAWAAGVAAIVAIFLGVFAWYSYRDANHRRQEADLAKIAAQRSDSLAQKEKENALLSADTARMATQAALRSDSLTKREKARADQALVDAKGNAQIAVKTLLTVAEKAIKQLNYTEASEAVNAAVRLEANKPAVAAALLEMAFFHNHTGDRATAVQETATAARWLNRSDLAAQAERLAGDTGPRALRDVQKALAPARFKELDERYFPKMIPVKGGTYTPGCVKPDDDFRQKDNKDGLFRASVPDFELAQTETTVFQYHLYTTALGRRIGQRITPAGTLEEYAPPTWGWVYDHPIIYVSWYDAVEYANWASEQQGLKPVYDIVKTERGPDNQNSIDEYGWFVRIREAANGYRLPTEAEWEFAARGGIRQDTFQYTGSDDLYEVAWWGENSGSRTQPVGGKKPNSLQLFDLSGNVHEWCWDWQGYYPQKPETDYRGASSGSSRVLRGGSWDYVSIDYYRPAYRVWDIPYLRLSDNGFRVARH